MDKPCAERRSQSPAGELRRFCFGLALAYSLTPLSSEAAEPPAKVQARNTRADTTALNLEPSRDQPIYTPYKALGRRHADGSAREVLSHTTFETDDLNILRAGLGVDLSLSEIGNMHFNLYSPDGDLDKGKRWILGASKHQPLTARKKVWSVGGTLELARTRPDGPRTVIVVPQLMFNLENLPTLGSNAQLSLQYLQWGAGDGGSQPVAQLAIKWSF